MLGEQTISNATAQDQEACELACREWKWRHRARLATENIRHIVVAGADCRLGTHMLESLRTGMPSEFSSFHKVFVDFLQHAPACWGVPHPLV